MIPANENKEACAIQTSEDKDNKWCYEMYPFYNFMFYVGNHTCLIKNIDGLPLFNLINNFL